MYPHTFEEEGATFKWIWVGYIPVVVEGTTRLVNFETINSPFLSRLCTWLQFRLGILHGIDFFSNMGQCLKTHSCFSTNTDAAGQ